MVKKKLEDSGTVAMAR